MNLLLTFHICGIIIGTEAQNERSFRVVVAINNDNRVVRPLHELTSHRASAAGNGLQDPWGLRPRRDTELLLHLTLYAMR